MPFLLTCHGACSTHSMLARPVFARAFRKYGLSSAIRPDDGAPFARQVIHGLSYLNVGRKRLGIQHQRSHPGVPQENGTPERMHETLKRGAIRPARATLAAQQRAFNSFRQEYIDERPHSYLAATRPPRTTNRRRARSPSGSHHRSAPATS